jgi:hypothetical protein
MAQIEGYNTFKVVGYPENFAVASKAAQNDYVLFNDPMVLIQSIYTDDGGEETFLAAAITVASIGEADTTITYSSGSGVPRLKGDYLLKVDQELIHVKADTDETADTGTLTVVRAAFGTEVASHEAGSAYLQNCIKLDKDSTGDVKILYKSLPMFRDGLNMSTEAINRMSTVNPNKIYGSEYPTA